MSRPTFCLLVLSGLASVVLSYPATFDNVNVDDLLQKPEVVDSYIACLLDTSVCNESGQRLKAIIPNALLKKCSECTPYQRESVLKISKAISAKKPAEWAKILEKYDPKSEHRSDIDSLLNSNLEKPAAPVKEAKPVARQAKPEDAPKPAEAAKPAAENSPSSALPAKLEEPSKPAEKPAEAKLSESAKLAESKPAEPAKLEEPSKAAESSKPSEIPKPDQAKPAESPAKPLST